MKPARNSLNASVQILQPEDDERSQAGHIPKALDNKKHITRRRKVIFWGLGQPMLDSKLRKEIKSQPMLYGVLLCCKRYHLGMVGAKENP
jgi:hypothetical protein